MIQDKDWNFFLAFLALVVLVFALICGAIGYFLGRNGQPLESAAAVDFNSSAG